MVGYKESLQIMKNLDVAVEYALRSEARFQTKDEAKAEAIARAEEARKKEEKARKISPEQFVRQLSPAAVQKETQEKASKKIDLQQKLADIETQNASAKKIDQQIEDLKAQLESYENKEDRNPQDENIIENIKRNLEILQSNRGQVKITPQAKIEAIQAQIDEIDNALSALSIERQDIQVGTHEKNTVDEIIENAQTEEIFGIEAERYDIEEEINESTTLGVPTISKINSSRRIETQESLMQVEESLNQRLLNWANDYESAGQTKTQKDVLNCLTAISIYDEKIQTISETLKITPNEDRAIEDMKKYRVLKEKEERALRSLTADIPELQELVIYRNNLKNNLALNDKSVLKESNLRDSLATVNTKEQAAALIREYYRETKTDSCNLIMWNSISYIKQKLFGENSFEDIIGMFADVPDDEQINLNNIGMLTPEELEKLHGVIQIDINRVNNFVKKIYRFDKNFHKNIIEKCFIGISNLEKTENKVLSKLNTEDLFAEIVFDYEPKAYSKGKLPRQVRNISSYSTTIIPQITTKLTKLLSDMISSRKGYILGKQAELRAELAKDAPEISKRKQEVIEEMALERESKLLSEYRIAIKRTDITEEEKQTLRKKFKTERLQIELEKQRDISLILGRDKNKIEKLKTEIQELHEKWIKMSGDTLSMSDFEDKQTVLKILEPKSKDLVPSAAQAFLFMADNPGKTEIEPSKIVSLLEAAKSVFKYVHDIANNAGLMWLKVYSWTPKPKEDKIRKFPFLNVWSKTEHTAQGATTKTTGYHPVGILFKMLLDKDYRKGIFTVSLTLKEGNGINYDTWGKITIEVYMDEAGKIVSEVKEVQPITFPSETKETPIPNRTDETSLDMQTAIVLAKAIRTIHTQKGGAAAISLQELMLNDETKKEIIEKAIEDRASAIAKAKESSKTVEQYHMIAEKKKNNQPITAEDTKPIIIEPDYESSREPVERMYEAMMPTNKKTARVRLLSKIRKFAANPSYNK